LSQLAAIQEACASFVAETVAADPAHDFSHIKRVVNNTLYLSDISKANKLVTLPAAWLHDCIQVAKGSSDRCRASTLAAREAVRFLAAISYPDALLPEVEHAVEAHSFSAGIPVRTLEAGVVQDADRLDALGSIGIARCLLTGGAMGSELYHPDDPFCEHRSPDDRAYMVDHFYAKLFKLPATMQTSAGREEALRRVAQMEVFLDGIAAETGIERPASG
jgi:uncharacterized protein